uniref:Galactan endo-beta-1,3-galactanase n=1 Tax=Flammulina velutipes TaxID=38945 RepID=E3GAL_FLAVE|nr:RecName: Full=Galactan endo-beta-1,3-galactanase; AltName: Full=Endo-beta-1,3-galactanase; Short=FvEN3GAL; Flags: Precursor [Flammulina velutipes]BAK48741.1 endo-beta-1,3-galactanase [Flammulina velutipes]
MKLFVVLACLAAPGTFPFVDAATVIPANSFSSFSTYWNNFYPWGTDHNGSGRMASANIIVASNTLSLIATPTSNPSPPTSTSNPKPAIHYASGAIHAKEHITVTAANAYTVSGEFSAPTAVGTWPAFWLTAVSGWPPEVDIGEWKGTADNWFNTFNTSSVVKSTLVDWPTDLSFHSVKAVLTAQSNNKDVKIDFYMDNKFIVTQYGSGFVGKAMYLIINLQMEGSSGSPGPSGRTVYKARNVQVTRTGN